MKLFVYGTLKRGHHNHRLLEKAQYISHAELWGYQMYSLGGFPGIKPSDGHVHGEVYEVEDLTRLDRLEGYDEERDDGMYLRREVIIRRPAKDGSYEDDKAYAYVWNLDVIGRPLIKDGVWR
jgi:gamma-glutamylcyclotransferase (GGCT)/AIG2-like uncharacterized protein YtfP